MPRSRVVCLCVCKRCGAMRCDMHEMIPISKTQRWQQANRNALEIRLCHYKLSSLNIFFCFFQQRTRDRVRNGTQTQRHAESFELASGRDILDNFLFRFSVIHTMK